jgi:penicillin amidase
MDWYREELELNAEGVPGRSRWEAGWQDLVRVDETYNLNGVLGDDPSEMVVPRWQTFDGRMVVEVEGRTVEDPEVEVLAAGESLINLGGTWVVPGDLDADGVVTGVSVDFTGHDVGNLVRAAAGFSRATTAAEFQEQMRDFVGYAQNMIVAGADGTIGFSPFTAMPCRDYLPRDADGMWVDGANPQMLLDGTKYGAFEMPVGPDGKLDPTLAGDDPQKCTVPWDVYPRILKGEGYIVNANNDPHGGSFDGRLTDEPAYVGGPWVPGYRANAIVRDVEASLGSAGIPEMVDAQADHTSQLGLELSPVAVAAIGAARALQGRPDAELTADEIRLRDLYASRPGRLDEVSQRLVDWVERGAEAASGVETFYNQPSAEDRTDAVATMIFNVWIRKWILRVFEYEQLDALLEQPGRARGSMMRAIRTLTEGQGAGNPLSLASWNPATEESIYFDDRATAGVVERSDEMAVASMLDALVFLQEEPATGFDGGFGTTEMDDWLWGLKHRVVLDSILAAFGAGNPAVNTIAKQFSIDTKLLPLADEIPEGDPRRRLRWFPRPGDFFGTDASNPSFYGDNFDYRDGPVMRMIIQLWPDGRMRGRNVVPAGQSGLKESPHYADLAALWLGNDALPMHLLPEDVAAAAIGREVLTP